MPAEQGRRGQRSARVVAHRRDLWRHEQRTCLASAAVGIALGKTGPDAPITTSPKAELAMPNALTASTTLATSRPKHFAVIAVMTASALLLLSGCAGATSGSSSAQSQQSLQSEHRLDGLDAREVIERLDRMPVADRPAELMASIQPDRLVLTDEQQSTAASLPMPEDDFYVSVAPYAKQTHECYFHSLTTCLGEFADTDVDVTVVNAATGETVLDETLTTYSNGFIELWLPRDIDATLTVSADGRTATRAISTRQGDPTCLTTLKLT